MLTVKLQGDRMFDNPFLLTLISEKKVKANWSLANFLPELVQKYFLICLATYTQKLHAIRPTSALEARPYNADKEQETGEDLRGTSVYSLDSQLTALRAKNLSAADKQMLQETKAQLLETTEKVALAAGILPPLLI